MIYAVNRTAESVLGTLARSPRIGDLNPQFSAGWHETADRRKGRLETSWGVSASWNDVILQGPHFHVSNPFNKSPNSTMRNNLDWSPVDLEALEPDAIPATCYKPAGDRCAYDSGYTHWGNDQNPKAARDYYRVAWRRMAGNTNERTLISAVIPPGTAHVHPVHTFALESGDMPMLIVAASFLSSLVCDFMVRSVPKSEILFSTIARMPMSPTHPLRREVQLRSARLNCLTSAYSDLWAAGWDDNFPGDGWTIPEVGSFGEIGDVETNWGQRSPLRLAQARRQAQLEIDALVALMLDVTADELCTIYRTQFPVLHGYDRNRDFYDANGRLVPTSVIQVWKRKGDAIDEDERTAANASGYTYTYELPFRTLDREHDMRVAYAEFERRLAQRA